MPPRARRPLLATWSQIELEERLVLNAAFDANHVIVGFSEVVPHGTQVSSLEAWNPTTEAESLGLGLFRVSLGNDKNKADLRRISGVRTVSRDYRIEVESISNDPLTSQNSAVSTSIGLATAWTTTTGTGNTIVAVLDTGVDVTHPDLAANLWRNTREIAGNKKDDDGNGYIDDIHGVDFSTNSNNLTDTRQHGTHVAGIIGAVGGNGIGTAGINWKTRIMPLKFIGADGGKTSDAIRAVDYAIRHGARIINTSWGGSPYDTAFAQALSRARTAGVIVVASAGNQGTNSDQTPFYPAAYSTQFDNVVSVAAVNANGTLASFSNFGAATVTIAAPGVNITSTLPNNRYAALSGTSMSAPVVSGALALLWDQNPTWTSKQVIARLKSTADTLPALQGKIINAGRLNVAKLITNAVTSPPAVPVAPPITNTDRAGPRVLSAQFSGAKQQQYDRIVVKFSESIDVTTLNNTNILTSGPRGPLRISSVVPLAGANNSEFILMLSASQAAAGNYTVSVTNRVRDAAGNRLDQNANLINGESIDQYTQSSRLTAQPTVPPTVPPAAPPVSPPATNAQNFSLPFGARAITARRTTRLEISVAASFVVERMTVTLPLNHPRPADLNIRLTAPNGTKVVLHNRTALTASQLRNLVFSDVGSTKPAQALSRFASANARGVWVLEIFDLGDGTAGQVQSATLSFTRATTASVAVPTSWSATSHKALTERDTLGLTQPEKYALLQGREDTISNKKIV